jgi:hypothetical protein
MSGIDWLRPGVYDGVSNADYQSDSICSRPSLTSGTVKRLINQSPRHAWTHHPRLNPSFRPVERDSFDLGSVVHAWLLQGGKFAEMVDVIDADDWRTKYAKERKADARASGMLPILTKDWERVQEMVDAVAGQLPWLEADPPVLRDGKPEQTLIWEDNGVLCRARCDWLRDDRRAIDDPKSTTASANPHDWTRRTFWSVGCDVQAVFYQRGAEKIFGTRPDFRFVVMECHPPYAVSVVNLAPSVVELAERKIDHAIQLWKQCLDTGEWPGYPPQVASVEIDSWQEADLLHRIGAAEEIAA